MLIGLSGVTETLQNLIHSGVYEAAGFNVSTSAAPPDTSPVGELSVHLFHVMESPDFKNHPPTRGRSDSPVQQAPMALILQYVLSVREQSEELNHLAIQDLFGYVARVLHDYPVVDSSLILTNPTSDPVAEPVLASSMFGQPIEFVLRPARMEETISFWGSEQNTMPRVSLFVEARVAVLEPTLPTVIPGRVYSIGGGVVASMGPQLFSGLSELTFALPVRTGREQETLTASPPRPSLIDSRGSDPGGEASDNSFVEFRAQGLAPTRSIVVAGEDVSVRAAIDGTSDNTAWEFDVGPDRLSFRVRETLRGEKLGEAGLQDVPVFPGAYSIRVLQRDERLGGLRLTSNSCPLTIIPQTLGISGTTERVLSVQGQYLHTLADDEVALMIDDHVYSRVANTATLQPGEFFVILDGTDTSVHFVLRGDAVPAVETPIAVNLLVRGVPATPEWLES